MAGLLVYLALRGANLGDIGRAMLQVNYLWFIPLIAVTLASHIVRAYRWRLLLDAIDGQEQRTLLRTAFSALMIGYMVNYALPRIGEVVRTLHVSAKERLSIAGVLGTVVIERVIDVLTLLVGLALTAVMLVDRTDDFLVTFLSPLGGALNWTLYLTIIFGLLGGVVAAIVLKTPNSFLRRFWNRRGQPAWAAFRKGIATAHRSPRRLMLVATTVVMWMLYVLMAYIPLVMLDMTGPYNLSFLDGMVIMFIGAIGVAMPFPGGIGSFHYITRVSLVEIYGVTSSLAVTYAVFVHGCQLILYVIVGLLAVILEKSSLGQLYAQAKATRRDC